MKNRTLLSGAVAVLALTLAACQSGVTLDLTPNPVIVGLLDTKATVHAHVVSHGGGAPPFDNVQFAVYNEKNTLLASTTEKIDMSGRTTVMDRDYTVPINGAVAALSGTKYIEVRILDPSGNTIAARRLDVVVHALKNLPLQDIFRPRDTTPTAAPATSAPATNAPQ